MAGMTTEEKKQYDASVSALESYPGGKLSQSEFSSMFGPIAREENRKSRIPASVTLAQAALETGWGASTIGSAKNLFGIKGTGPAGTTVVSTQECANGQYYTIKAGFKKYNTWMESIEDHTKVLQLPYYKNAFNYCDDPDQFAREVHKGGYATAHNYADTLISIMKTNNFYKWNVSSKNAGSGNDNAPQQNNNNNQTQQQSGGNSSGGSVTVGSKVKVTGTKYATGQTVPNWVKQNTYTVTQVSNGRALLSDIISWVNIGDLAVQGGGSKTEAPKPQTKEDDSKPASTQNQAPAQQMTELQKLLVDNPSVKTNQHLINLFYSMGGNTFNGAAAVATRYGVDINALCNNRSGAVSRPSAAQTQNTGSTTSSGTGSSSSSGSSSGGSSSGSSTLQELLKANPGVQTNQDLINLFYSMSNGTFNGASQVASKYGVDINALCNNRSGRVSGAASGGSTQQQSGGNSGGSSSGGSSSGGGSSDAQKVIDKARTFVSNPHHPYVWGGKGDIITRSLINGLANQYGWGYYSSRITEQHYNGQYRAFDCSGLCCWTYKNVLGKDISEGYGWQPNAGKAIKTFGSNVQESDLKVGDVICSPGHYTMYRGGGKCVESCGSMGLADTNHWRYNGVNAVYRYL